MPPLCFASAPLHPPPPPLLSPQLPPRHHHPSILRPHTWLNTREHRSCVVCRSGWFSLTFAPSLTCKIHTHVHALTQIMFDDDLCFAHVVQAASEGGFKPANPPVRASQATMALCCAGPNRVMDAVKYFLHDKFRSRGTSVAPCCVSYWWIMRRSAV
jgi:hypothetical protein